MPAHLRRRHHAPQSQPQRADPARRNTRQPGSNTNRISQLQQPGSAQTEQSSSANGLDSVLDHIIAGSFEDAQSAAHTTANQARSTGGDSEASQAGLAWQIAAAFDKAQDAMAEKNYEAAKSHAANAATQARALLSAQAASADDLNLIISSAGEAWTVANKAAEQAAKDRQGGLDAPMLDQHEFNHWNKGAFCGLATMIMMLRANGIEQGSGNADLNALASQVYIPDAGTSGSAMASVLRQKGLKDSNYVTNGGRSKLIASLDKGQTVPFGVVLCSGTITKLAGGSSQRYSGARVGDQHYRRFGPSGHWVLVTRYEGKPEAPTAFIVNDPDLGGELRCTPAQLESMGAGSGNFWMVHQ